MLATFRYGKTIAALAVTLSATSPAAHAEQIALHRIGCAPLVFGCVTTAA